MDGTEQEGRAKNASELIPLREITGSDYDDFSFLLVSQVVDALWRKNSDPGARTPTFSDTAARPLMSCRSLLAWSQLPSSRWRDPGYPLRGDRLSSERVGLPISR